MRRLAASLLQCLIVWLVCATALPAWAAIALDQSTAEEHCDNCGTLTKDISFGTAPAPGSLVVGCVTGGDFTAVNTDLFSGVADNQGNGAYSLVEKLPATGGTATAALFYKENVASSGTFTITLTTTNTTLMAYTWKVLSFTSIATSSPLDQSATGGAITAETALSITTGALSQNDELVVACMGANDIADTDTNMDQNAAGYTNFILQENDSVRPSARGDYKIVSSSSAQNTNWGFDSQVSTAGVIATFKQAAGGGGGSTVQSNCGALMLLGVQGC